MTDQTSFIPDTPLRTLLSTLRTSARSQAEKGQYFEQLSIQYLKHEPKYRNLYASVQPFAEFAAQHHLQEKDTGIDVVATTRDGQHHAVQCKFYAEERSIGKADIDSFMSASGHQLFTQRLIIDTSGRPWGGNAETMLAGQLIPVARISLTELENSQIDWAQYAQHAPLPVSHAAHPNPVAGFSLSEPPPRNPYTVPLKPQKQPRADQQTAIANVLQGLRDAERGKLIMACGTGKTFTSLKIAEQQAGAGKHVLFLVPSLALLSQTLTEWSQQSQLPITAFAVCSDSEVGKRKTRHADHDDAFTFTLHDLAWPATTNAATLARQVQARHAPDAMTVVFSTYHSIDVIHQAQKTHKLPAFDLVICDEAHRTTGQTWLDDKNSDDESAFVRIHDNAIIQAKKRLYMTATPRIYSSEAKKQTTAENLVLYSMDDETIYGKTLHLLSFSAAVEQKLLVPYKVVVLTIAEKDMDDILKEYLTRHDPAVDSIPVNDAAKIVGCFKALAKQGLTDLIDDPAPMQRAVAFCQVIGEDSKGQPVKTSKTAARHVAKTFADIVAEYQNNTDEEEKIDLHCEVDYVHGGMGAAQKTEKIDWLKQHPGDNTCRILTNVRCLSEGVDVPALDAVLFLTPRNSQIEVVQSVGRVMRKSAGKKRGYIILPVVIPYGKEPHKALNDNKTYQVVWQVLQALRAHDDEFERFINRIELLGSDPGRIQIIDPIGLSARKTRQTTEQRERSQRLQSARSQQTIGAAGQNQPSPEQIEIPLSTGEIERAILAKVVQKVGNRDYWEQWAQDIARIAQMQIARITSIIENPQNTAARAAFDGFTAQLHQHINTRISQADIIEMLAQHLITRPVFDALFGNSDFTRHNPISAALQTVTDILLSDFHLDSEHQSLEKFYEHIRKKTAGIHDPAARQTLIVTLYDQFFAQAFPRVTQKHGIVYTPVEIVDFILHSVAHVLQTQLNKTLADPDVQVLDPFTGTGTFIARLLASGLITPEQLPTVYQNQLHATEILLLPYYIAAVNIESTFAQRCPQQPYMPFPGILLADTFNIPTEKTETLLDNKNDALAANNARRRRQMESKITVIVGNPPYSVGQKSANDNNQNVNYPELDNRIKTTYVAGTTATNKNALYDSYIRAIRWASDRIDKEAGGIIGFVTNAGWLDSAATDGLRKCLVEEFSSLYIFHLRGNARTQGEQRRKEADNVFDQGSRAPIAISILVKTPQSNSQTGEIHFCDIGDYLSREQKLQKIAELKSIAGIEAQKLWQSITPDNHGDWLNQRQGDFSALLPMGDAKNKNKPGNRGIFVNYSNGVKTQRDPWCNNPSRMALLDNVRRLVDFYEAQRQRGAGADIDNDPTKISWTRTLQADLARDKALTFNPQAAAITLYRPFNKAWLYYDRRLNEMVYQMPQIFPLPTNADQQHAAQGSLLFNNQLPLPPQNYIKIQNQTTPIMEIA